MMFWTDAKMYASEYEFAAQYREELVQKNLAIVKFKEANAQKDKSISKYEDAIEKNAYASAEDKKTISAQGGQITVLKIKNTVLTISAVGLAGGIIYMAIKN